MTMMMIILIVRRNANGMCDGEVDRRSVLMKTTTTTTMMSRCFKLQMMIIYQLCSLIWFLIVSHPSQHYLHHNAKRSRLCTKDRISCLRTQGRTGHIPIFGLPHHTIPSRVARDTHTRRNAHVGDSGAGILAAQRGHDRGRRTTGRGRSGKISHRPGIAGPTLGRERRHPPDLHPLVHLFRRRTRSTGDEPSRILCRLLCTTHCASVGVGLLCADDELSVDSQCWNFGWSNIGHDEPVVVV